LDLCPKAKGLDGNLRSTAQEQIRIQTILVTGQLKIMIMS
jgi:hypothetical protein